jgi:hypothetical protein
MRYFSSLRVRGKRTPAAHSSDWFVQIARADEFDVGHPSDSRRAQNLRERRLEEELGGAAVGVGRELRAGARLQEVRPHPFP